MACASQMLLAVIPSLEPLQLESHVLTWQTHKDRSLNGRTARYYILTHSLKCSGKLTARSDWSVSFESQGPEGLPRTGGGMMVFCDWSEYVDS